MYSASGSLCALCLFAFVSVFVFFVLSWPRPCPIIGLFVITLTCTVLALSFNPVHSLLSLIGILQLRLHHVTTNFYKFVKSLTAKEFFIDESAHKLTTLVVGS